MKERFKVDFIANKTLTLEQLCEVINHSEYFICEDTHTFRLKAEPIYSKDKELTIELKRDCLY